MMRRRGVAIPVVLAFLIAMVTFGTFIFQMMRQQNKQNMTNHYHLQASFLARAGMEHALLKVKYMPRELYDAVCLAQGRNPLFDFSRPIDPTTNPGPVFLYRKGEAVPTGESFVTPNFETAFAGRVNPPKTWLGAYMADLNSGTELSLGVGKPLKVNNVMSLYPPPPELKELLTAPFKKAAYEVTSLDIASQGVADQDSKVQNQMVVEITVKAELINSFNDKWRQTLKRTVRVSRDSRF